MAEKNAATDESLLTIPLTANETEYLQRWAKEQGYDAASTLVQTWLRQLILYRMESQLTHQPVPLFVEEWPLEMMASKAFIKPARKKRTQKNAIDFAVIQDQGQHAGHVSASYVTQLTDLDQQNTSLLD